jgi:hypothetical protein
MACSQLKSSVAQHLTDVYRSFAIVAYQQIPFGQQRLLGRRSHVSEQQAGKLVHRIGGVLNLVFET